MEIAKRYTTSVTEPRLLAGVLLLGAPTFTLEEVADKESIVVQVKLTWAAATTLTLKPEASINGGVGFGRVPTISPASGAVAVSAGLWTYTTGGAGIELTLAFQGGYDKFKMTFGGAGATTDTIDAWVVSRR